MAKAKAKAKATAAAPKAKRKAKAPAKQAAAKPKAAPKSAKGGSSTDAILKELRAFGLAYPGAHLKSPWPEHLDLAVNDKTFAYLSLEGQPLGVGCKLPKSAAMALMLPFATPMAYGLGKSGWVSAQVPPGTPVDVDMFKAWLDESYRAQAPKTLVKQLDAGFKAAGK
jgi:predicted DNA-binding protein (MmcQ/YjbR family)